MKYLSSSPAEKKCFIFWRVKQSAISKTYGNNTRMRKTHQFEICCQTPRSDYFP